MFEELLKSAQERLARICVSVAPALDGLTVESRVLEGPAAKTLMDSAVGADLLVVGTRGHGGFAGLLLGFDQRAVRPPQPVPGRDRPALRSGLWIGTRRLDTYRLGGDR